MGKDWQELTPEMLVRLLNSSKLPSTESEQSSDSEVGAQKRIWSSEMVTISKVAPRIFENSHRGDSADEECPAQCKKHELPSFSGENSERSIAQQSSDYWIQGGPVGVQFKSYCQLGVRDVWSHT